MANRVYASPGVYTSEKDLTYSIETIGVTTLGAAGETVKGPAFQPIPVKNYDQFSTIFGGVNPEKFKNTQIVKYELSYIAKNYLSQSNQMYVTRILGLSGYDKGDAFAIRTIGAIDQDTLETEITTGSTINFTGTTTGTIFNVAGTSTNVLNRISAVTGIPTSKFVDAYNSYFAKYTIATGTTNNFWKHDVFHWGVIPTGVTANIVAIATSPANDSDYNNTHPGNRDAYVYPSGLPSNEKSTYFINKEFEYDTNDDTYYGISFILTTDNVAVNGSTVSGEIVIRLIDYTASPNEKYHNKLVSTLRGKGIYINDSLEFLVSGDTVNFGDFSGITSNPYGDFTITGLTVTNEPFSYTVSLDTDKKNYIKNVLGVSNNDKTTELYVEDVFDATLAKGWLNGFVKGLNPTLAYIEQGEAGAWDHFKFQFQSPATPYFVSELRGDVTEDLFRVISISDGEHANTEIKISIANVDLAKKTFDLYVRRFEDTDKTPVIIERYTNCTMDKKSSNFIGRLVGTIDNEFELNSSYIIIELAENAPADAVPSGFNGYNFKSTEGVGVPEITYKTKYYKPGDVWQSNPMGIDLVSSGDKVRKTYLGFTDVDYGFDRDITKFQGKVNGTGTLTYNTGNDWGTMTKGFHFDVNADTELFEVGDGQFTDAVLLATDPTQTYYDIKTRKFTALFFGGFDGWDMYREIRTTGDLYRIGQSGFINGQFASFSNAEYDETFGSSDYYAYLYGFKTYQNPEKVNINILVTPGIDVLNNNELCQEVIEIVEEKRLDSIYLPTLPDINLYNNNNPANTDDWLFPVDISEQMDNLNLDSNYTAIYYPWIQIADTENNAYLWIPPTAEIVRNLAYTDNVSFPWFATAGYNRGLVNCKRTRIVLDQDARDIIYPARINPIATFSDVGNVIWGNRNLQLKDSALNRLNIRRLLLQARKLIISVANRLLFDPNDATVRSQFLSLVNPILDNIRKERGLTDFRIKLDPVSDTDRNTMTGKIFIKPTDALEEIRLEFDVTPTSVSFANI